MLKPLITGTTFTCRPCKTHICLLLPSTAVVVSVTDVEKRLYFSLPPTRTLREGQVSVMAAFICVSSGPGFVVVLPGALYHVLHLYAWFQLGFTLCAYLVCWSFEM